MTADTPAPQRTAVSFGEAFVLFFKNALVASGRSSRSAYWWWMLWSAIIGIALTVVDWILFAGILSMEELAAVGVFSNLFSLLTLIPGITLTIRRLHDVDRSGWLYLLVFTCIGIIPVFIWLVSPGTAGPNKFGPDVEAGRIQTGG